GRFGIQNSLMSKSKGSSMRGYRIKQSWLHDGTIRLRFGSSGVIGKSCLTRKTFERRLLSVLSKTPSHWQFAEIRNARLNTSWQNDEDRNIASVVNAQNTHNNSMPSLGGTKRVRRGGIVDVTRQNVRGAENRD